MNRSEACRGAPGGGLIAESCKVILTARPRADADLIERARTVAARCHQGQTRYSGDPYITHPVAVARILARLHDVDVVDDPTLCAAILHDTVEDTPYTLAALKRDFGTEIALMVTQIMALDRLGGQQEREVTQVMAMIRSADTRVVAVKVADRLHNMQTLQFLPPNASGLGAALFLSDSPLIRVMVLAWVISITRSPVLAENLAEISAVLSDSILPTRTAARELAATPEPELAARLQRLPPREQSRLKRLIDTFREPQPQPDTDRQSAMNSKPPNRLIGSRMEADRRAGDTNLDVLCRYGDNRAI